MSTYFQSSGIFIDTLYKCEYITDFDKAVLHETLKDYMSDLPAVSGVFYLDRPIDWCINNIQKRGRVGEQNICVTHYLSCLRQAYESYLETTDCDKIICRNTDLRIAHTEFVKFADSLK